MDGARGVEVDRGGRRTARARDARDARDGRARREDGCGEKNDVKILMRESSGAARRGAARRGVVESSV
jgi:hypothetical protein